MISLSGNAYEEWIEEGVERADLPLFVNGCGYQKLLKRDLTRRRERGRLDFQLICFVSGKGAFRFKDGDVEAHAGQIVVYRPGEPQHYDYCARDGAEAYWIHFTGYAARDYLERFGLLGSRVYTVGAVDELAGLFKAIIRELNLAQPLNGDMAAAHLLTLLALAGRRLRNANALRDSDPHAEITKILEYMHEAYNRKLVVADLAKRCNLSLFRFIHKFKAVTGAAPLQYLTGIRINEAKRMLAETPLHVKEIASIVGYDNPLYFSRVFQRAVGVPPSRYKQVLQEEPRPLRTP